MCLKPKILYREGRYKESTYKGQKGEQYQIACYTKCGYCEQCKNEKSNNWVVRNYYESKRHKKACFITLTYKENPNFLLKKHLQNFIKRLRRHLEYYDLMPIAGYKQKINKKTGEIKLIPVREHLRYYACGEYGTLHHRPHYHIIIYNWKDDDAEYLDINKKGNVICKSKIIDKVWGYGRTTYQEFDAHEIPYITLYETPAQEFARDYIISKENAKKYIAELKKKEQTHIHRYVMIKTLENELKNKENKKSEYITIKEFNLWSTALGWEEFVKNYYKYNNYDWQEYIEDKTFLTPSPWVKKLANNGDAYAIAEMLRRASELATNLTAQELATKNQMKWNERHTEKVKEWAEKKESTVF